MSEYGTDYTFEHEKSLQIHNSDVRAVRKISLPGKVLVTASRDATVKLFGNIVRSVDVESTDLHEECLYFGSSHFMSCVCYFPPHYCFPLGLILAGSHDNNIYVYDPSILEPKYILNGHSGTVCALAVSGNLICSGSWDKSLRVWEIPNLPVIECIGAFTDHGEAVWAVAIHPWKELVATGSADKLIRIWNPKKDKNQPVQLLIGHIDCVRALIFDQEEHLFSTGNDSTVRLWDISGNCIGVYYNLQESYIYDIVLLDNGKEIATSSDDGWITIWTPNNGSYKPHQVFNKVNETFWSLTVLKNGNIVVGSSCGSIHILKKSLRSCNSVKAEDIIKSGPLSCYPNEERFPRPTICKYKWDPNENKFKFPPLDKDCSTFIRVSGQLYHLSFNKFMDSHLIARAFLSQNSLSLSDEDQVSEFISKIGTLRQQQIHRFSVFEPKREYTLYYTKNLPGLRDRILKYNQEVSDDKKVSESDILKLCEIPDNPTTFQEVYLNVIEKILSWNEEWIYPIYDLIRVSIFIPEVRAKICGRTTECSLMNSTKSENNQLLIVKIFCNLFDHDDGRRYLARLQPKITYLIKRIVMSKTGKLEKAAGILFRNYAVMGALGLPMMIHAYCIDLVDLLGYVTDEDAMSRLLEAIGTIACFNDVAFSCFIGLDVVLMLDKDILVKNTIKNETLKSLIEDVKILLCDYVPISF